MVYFVQIIFCIFRTRQRKCTSCHKTEKLNWAVCTYMWQKDEKKLGKANLLVQKNYAIMNLL